MGDRFGPLRQALERWQGEVDADLRIAALPASLLLDAEGAPGLDAPARGLIRDALLVKLEAARRGAGQESEADLARLRAWADREAGQAPAAATHPYIRDALGLVPVAPGKGRG
ncbi:hypothetical protein [Pseudoponticoccus marisrubri]|uniref:Uncharacterized protein n=1 Tax=Pseudoponticoccus marisrubri TaxID=1685382 RepID=A0A0W7WQ90_9RHOB|nr:hypothetical protein [Pseudoponticoccus marisrubri]KUF12755.1 hypothetical protein AVJ23_03330 [Pseudoponticoccus marisrubri]